MSVNVRKRKWHDGESKAANAPTNRTYQPRKTAKTTENSTPARDTASTSQKGIVYKAVDSVLGDQAKAASDTESPQQEPQQQEQPRQESPDVIVLDDSGESDAPAEFIPLEQQTQQRSSKNERSKIPTNPATILTPGGKHVLEPKYRSAYNNEVRPDLGLPPWAKKPYEKGHLSLHQEILDFVEYMSPTPIEMVMRENLIERTKHTIMEVFPGCQVEVFGSVVTGLCLPSSDIDMVVLGVNPSPHKMWALANRFRQTNQCPQPQVITSARVPLVKIVDSYTGVQVDISFNQVGGIRNSETIINYLREYTAAKPLVMVLKHFVLMRDLHEPYSGGLGSYALVLLVVSFLQQQCNKGRGEMDMNLGYLLIDFLDFYGNLFNFWTTGISLRNGGTYFKKLDRHWYDYQRPFLLALEDPNDENNDVGRSAYRILNARFSFQEAYSRLTTSPKRKSDYAPTLLTRILQPNYLIEANRAAYEKMFRPMLEMKLQRGSIAVSNATPDVLPLKQAPEPNPANDTEVVLVYDSDDARD